MVNEQDKHTITIKNEDLYNKLTTFAETSGRSIEDVTEEALNLYFEQTNKSDDESSDDVFNPDPGA